MLQNVLTYQSADNSYPHPTISKLGHTMPVKYRFRKRPRFGVGRNLVEALLLLLKSSIVL